MHRKVNTEGGTKSQYWISANWPFRNGALENMTRGLRIPLHESADIYETAYLFTRTRVNGALTNPGQWLQKDAVKVNRFTGFVGMKGRFL